MLAGALHLKRAQTHGHKLRSSSKHSNLVFHSSKIASRFRSYYAELYNLDTSLSPSAKDIRLEGIREYLSTINLLCLTNEQWSDMDSPMTVEETESIVKSLPNGKGLGPDGFTKAYYNVHPLTDQPRRYFNSLTNSSIIPPIGTVGTYFSDIERG